MAQSHHGMPCWYELSTSNIADAQTFYANVLGWTVSDSGTPGMDYRIGRADDAMVAGMMQAGAGMPTGWTLYFTVDSCDKTAAEAAALGATVIVPPADIPNTGRFSILIDPQGAGFGLLQPLPGGMAGAFDQQKAGHGNWHEIITADPMAAFGFYQKLFGWTMTREMPMGPEMIYRIFACNGLEIGGTFAPSPAAPAYWKAYFGSASIQASVAAIPAHGGKILRGPDEVPGGSYSLQIEDNEGVRLALVGPM